MNLKVVYYGQIRDLVEVDHERVDVGDECSAVEAVKKVAKAHGATFEKMVLTPEGEVRGSVLVSINGEVVDAEAPAKLRDGDEVAIFTAVAGG